MPPPVFEGVNKNQIKKRARARQSLLDSYSEVVCIGTGDSQVFLSDLAEDLVPDQMTNVSKAVWETAFFTAKENIRLLEQLLK